MVSTVAGPCQIGCAQARCSVQKESGMASKRRRGPENSATRTALMDAVEAVMREDGYAALSARSVARRAGLKYQIVFYYFETMDALLLATYRRRTQTVLERTEN